MSGLLSRNVKGGVLCGRVHMTSAETRRRVVNKGIAGDRKGRKREVLCVMHFCYSSTEAPPQQSPTVRRPKVPWLFSRFCARGH